MDFEFVGNLNDIETIAIEREIRALPRLRRLYGKGRWRRRHLFSADRFVAIDVPARVKKSLLEAPEHRARARRGR